jgi:hypothetical protein
MAFFRFEPPYISEIYNNAFEKFTIKYPEALTDPSWPHSSGQHDVDWDRIFEQEVDIYNRKEDAKKKKTESERLKKELEEEDKLRELNGIPPGFVQSPCQEEDLEKKDDPKCKVKSLIIQKGRRQVELNKSNPKARFEVVGGNLETFNRFFGTKLKFNPAKINCSATYLAGPCSDKGIESHVKKVFDVSFTPSEEITNTSLKFDAYSEWVLWPPNATPVEYCVNLNTCSESLEAIIAVYPDIEAGFGIEWKYQTDKYNEFRNDSVKTEEAPPIIKRISKRKTKTLRQESVSYTEERSQKIKISNGISIYGYYKFSGIEIKPTLVFKDIIETLTKIESIMEPLVGLINTIKGQKTELIKKAEEVNSRNDENTSSKDGNVIIFPCVDARLSFLWQEIEGSPFCEFGALITLSLNPLFGLSFQYDLTYAILRATGVGNTIAELKEIAESKSGAKIFALTLTAGFQVKVDANWEYNNGFLHPPKSSGEITFPIKLEATAFKGKMKKDLVFKIHAEIEVEVGAKGESGISVKAVGKAGGLDLSVDWLGLKVTLAAKYKTCVYRTVNNCSPPAAPSQIGSIKGNNGEIISTKTDNKKEKSMEGTFKISGKPIYGPTFIKLW